MNPTKNYIGSALIALAMFSIWGWLVPEYNKISDLNLAIGEREVLLDSRSQIISNIRDMSQEYQTRSADIARISSVLPSRKSLAELISALDSISLQSGLQLFNASVVSQQTGQTENQFSSLPINLSMSGSYPALVSFLESIEKNIRIIDIVSINAAAGDDPDFLTFSIRANTYYLQ